LTRRDEAHFLHGARPLDPVISAPIDEPRVVAAIPRDSSFLVATATGTIYRFDPALGTQRLFDARPEPAAMAVEGGHIALLGRDGVVSVWDLAGTCIREEATGLLAQLHVCWWGGGLAVIGDDLSGRRAIVYGRAVRTRARVPLRTALGTAADGSLLLARVTDAGLDVVPFGEALSQGPSTTHTLRFGAPGPTVTVAGVAPGGVTVWSPGALPVSIRLFDVVNTAVHGDGTCVALATRTGTVAIAAARVGDARRVRPAQVEGHEGPVMGLAFSDRGRWLASVAERCRIWTW
jgi:hypothetical protein